MDLTTSLIKNPLQQLFNEIKGEIIEINIEEKFSNITLQVGKENSRIVNLTGKTIQVMKLMEGLKLNDRVIAKFYISSHKKNDRYYTNATILELNKLF